MTAIKIRRRRARRRNPTNIRWFRLPDCDIMVGWLSLSEFVGASFVGLACDTVWLAVLAGTKS